MQIYDEHNYKKQDMPINPFLRGRLCTTLAMYVMSVQCAMYVKTLGTLLT